MTGDDINKELEQLRAEVAALAAARADSQASEAEQRSDSLDSAATKSQPADQEAVSELLENAQSAVGDDAELKGQFDQFFEQLEHEIKELPAITTLAVFSLGVLFGRLLK